MNFRQATDILGLSLADIAEALGRTHTTVAAYRAGMREPPPEVMEKLADFMEEHARRLLAEAPRLRRTASVHAVDRQVSGDVDRQLIENFLAAVQHYPPARLESLGLVSRVTLHRWRRGQIVRLLSSTRAQLVNWLAEQEGVPASVYLRRIGQSTDAPST